MRAAWAVLPALLIPAAIASGQNYEVETTKLLEVYGNVKSGSCGGGCCEGHDSTACVGVQVRDEDGVLLRTAIYDNASCCDAQCRDRQNCGPFSIIGLGKDGPADSCPSNYSRFSAPFGKLNLCVAPGETFLVPVRQAKLGNVVNNSWTTGSKCSARDRFEPYSDLDLGTYTSWGGFTDTCPDPRNPNIVCVPSDCTPGEPGGGSGAVPRYAAEIISPYGNEHVTRWDGPEVALRWRPIGRFRLDSYRVVAYGEAGRLIDKQVGCAAAECWHVALFPSEAASYYWWVQPLSPTAAGEQSRAGVFNLSPPLTSCAGLGGSCAGSTEPGVPATCAEGATLIGGALDCPDTCCGVDCSDELSHDHTGSCGSTDSCGHVFGTPSDSGCGPVDPGDTPSCGELGGDYCSTTFSCPAGYVSLGTTRQNGAVECLTCCKQDPATPTPTPPPAAPSCGAMGGDYCSQSGICPGGYSSLGLSYDCNPCCKQNPVAPTPTPPPAAPSCGAMGGDYCSQSGSCPGTHDSLGKSSDCNPCCVSKPSCGAMGGDYCAQGGSCPEGFSSLGRSVDCNPCCVTQ